MIGSVVRSVGAVIAGLVVAMVFAVGVEGVSAILHPFPPGADPTDYETCRLHVARYPAGVLLLVSLGWGLGTLVSAWLATRLGAGRHVAHGIVIGLILLAAAVANMVMLPYPVWFWVLNLTVFPLAIYAGARFAQARSSPWRNAAG